MNRSNRNGNIEMLRTIAMLLVLLLHISSYLFDKAGEIAYTLDCIFRSYFFLGVSVFAFISGYYGVKYNGRKMFNYEMMGLFWGG